MIRIQDLKKYMDSCQASAQEVFEHHDYQTNQKKDEKKDQKNEQKDGKLQTSCPYADKIIKTVSNLIKSIVEFICQECKRTDFQTECFLDDDRMFKIAQSIDSKIDANEAFAECMMTLGQVDSVENGKCHPVAIQLCRELFQHVVQISSGHFCQELLIHVQEWQQDETTLFIVEQKLNLEFSESLVKLEKEAEKDLTLELIQYQKIKAEHEAQTIPRILQDSKLDISMIFPRLYQGSSSCLEGIFKPSFKLPIHTIVVCAKEIDPIGSNKKLGQLLLKMGKEKEFIPFPKNVNLVRVEWEDSDEQVLFPEIDTTAFTILKEMGLGKNVLVLCQQGISRSSVLVARTIILLMMKGGELLSAQESIAFLKTKRPAINVRASFIKQLENRM